MRKDKDGESKGSRKPWKIERPPPSDTESNASAGRSKSGRKGSGKPRSHGKRDDDASSVGSGGSARSADSARSGSRVVFAAPSDEAGGALDHISSDVSVPTDSHAARAVNSTSPIQHGDTLATSAQKNLNFMKLPFAPQTVEAKSKMISEKYIANAKGPNNRRSVREARRDLQSHVMQCLASENIDYEMIAAIGDAVRIFNKAVKAQNATERNFP